MSASSTPLARFLPTRDYTPTSLARELGVDRSHIIRLVHGNGRPSPELAKRIEAVFKKEITRDQILFPEEYPFDVTKKKPTRSARPVGA
jgi:transcriptional regulator with XRE-family HTH domain